MNSSKNPSERLSGGNRWILGWLPYGAYSLLVLHGTVARPESIPHFLLRLNDKLVHGAEYFLFFWFGVNAYRRARSVIFKRHAGLWAFGAVLVMGGLTEGIQHFVPYRSMELLDFAADAAAGLIGLGLFAILNTGKERSG